MTDLFRGVDCANPTTDFEGRIIVCTEKVAKTLKVPDKNRIRILSCSIEQSGEDNLESIPQIAPYNHLANAYQNASKDAGVDFSEEFRSGRAILETYTCFPVVPLAFLLKSGLVKDMSGIESFLNQYEITVTGGLNLAKAPWNNTTLSAMVDIVKTLGSSKKKMLAGVHSVCALGYREAFAILGNETS